MSSLDGQPPFSGFTGASAAGVAPIVTGWTRDTGPPATVRLTTATDQVSIGQNAPIANRKLTVVETGANEGISYLAEAANVTSVFLEAAVSGEAAVRFTTNVAGLMSWGGGAGAVDATLGRGAADRLELGSGDFLDAIGAGGLEVRNASGDANPTIRVTSGLFEVGLNSADNLSVKFGVSVSNRLDFSAGDNVGTLGAGVFGNRNLAADANNRMELGLSSLSFGPGGASALDTVLQRQAANTFETGSADSLYVVNATLGVRAASADANPTASLLGAVLRFGAGGATAQDIRLARTGTRTLTIDDNNGGAADVDILPVADNTNNIGSNALRFKLVRAVTITSGSHIFQDEQTKQDVWKIHEDADYLYFQSMITGQDVMKVDRDGNLYLRGKVKPWKD